MNFENSLGTFRNQLVYMFYINSCKSHLNSCSCKKKYFKCILLNRLSVNLKNNKNSYTRIINLPGEGSVNIGPIDFLLKNKWPKFIFVKQERPSEFLSNVKHIWIKVVLSTFSGRSCTFVVQKKNNCSVDKWLIRINYGFRFLIHYVYSHCCPVYSFP